MKIICIGKNYVKHVREMGGEVPAEPVIFMKPGEALFSSGDFKIPSFSNDLHHELEIVVKINKKGKSIKKENAASHYEELGLGIDFTARDIQKELTTKGFPWEKAKAFDQSAFISSFFPKEKLTLQTAFSLHKNKHPVQIGKMEEMVFSIEEIIVSASQYFTLNPGDLIYTGTPEGVGKIVPGDFLEGYLSDEKLFELKITE